MPIAKSEIARVCLPLDHANGLPEFSIRRLTSITIAAAVGLMGTRQGSYWLRTGPGGRA